MLLNVTCKKCQTRYKLDIGDKTIEQTKEILKKQFGFECPGHHVELGSPVDYLEFGTIEPGSALSDKEWLKKMKKDGFKLMDTDQVRKKYTCTGFSMGLFCGKEIKTGKDVVLDFTTSPGGKRYYY